MARLYAIKSSIEEIGAQFEVPAPGRFDVPAELVEGVVGPIVIEREGCRKGSKRDMGSPTQRQSHLDFRNCKRRRSVLSCPLTTSS